MNHLCMARVSHFLMIAAATASAGLAGDNRWTCVGPFGGTYTRIAFHPSDDRLVVASHNMGFLSRDSGSTWKGLGIGGIMRFHPKDPRTILSAADTNLMRSTDLGISWQQIAHVSFDPEDSFRDIEFSRTDPQVIYASTGRHGVLKSTDGGQTWSEKNKGLNLKFGDRPSMIEVDPTDAKKACALLSCGIVYKTTDGGDSWTRLKAGVLCIALDPSDPNTLYAGVPPG